MIYIFILATIVFVLTAGLATRIYFIVKAITDDQSI